jgi:phosphoribosyl-ATP pyrophosphohydrolase/phosphoribosyl-AMP cyclohydrolase
MDIPLMAAYAESLEVIEGRAQGLAAGKQPETYTEKLLADQNERIKKLGSEAAELVREECRPDFDADRFIGEAADLVYAVQVAVVAKGQSFLLVLGELARRNKV